MSVSRFSVRIIVGIAAGGFFLAWCGGPVRNAGIKCKADGVVDSQSGLTAFRFLIPEGWHANTSFRWLPPTNTAFGCDLSVSTPDLHSMVDCVEHTVLTYTGFGNQPGKGVFIEKASDFLRFRAEKLTSALKDVSGFSVLDEQNTELAPDPMQQIGTRFGSGDSMHSRTYLHQAGYLEVRFKMGGINMVAEMGTEVFGETSTVQIPGQNRPTSVSQLNRVGPTLTVMLEADAPQKRWSEAKIIASSFQMTREFQAYWVKLTTHAAKVQMGANRADMEANNANWHERSMANFRKQMDAKSAATHGFCNMAANQQDYHLGNAIVTLPNDYKGWYDPNAKVLMIDDDPQFVPTGPGTRDFRALQPATGGH